MEQAISLGGFDPIQACVRSSGTSDTGKRLACQSCQRRKVKCDRDLPCLACRKNGLQCIAVVNQRLPRGLSGGRRKAGGDLANRIGKLESLIKSAQHLGQLPLATSSCNSSNKEQPAEPDDAVPCSQYQYLGSAFWTSLQDELRNLETELNSSDIDGSVDDLAEDAHTPAESSNGDSPLPFDPVFGIISSPVLLQHPLPLLKVHLCSVYFQNIDPVFKVLHAPSVRSHVELGVPYLSYSDDDSAVAALEFVMYYAAVTTMTDVECETTLWQTKRQALRQFRIMAEAALVQAEYIITTDITTLQAFVIYLAVLRHEDRSRRTWTMAALAARIALAMGLQNNSPSHNFFDTQQRRRVWHSLCVLDLQLAVDLASDRLITSGRSDTPLPLNVNDNDFTPGCDAVAPRIGWTDMSFSLITMEITIEADRSHSLKTESSKQKEAIIHDLDMTLQARYLAFCDPQIPLQAFAISMTKSTVAACRLHAMRGTTKISTPIASPPIDSGTVLSVAVEALAYSQECLTNPLMTGWRWTLWVQWHSIAVAFASLSLITQGELADRAWVTVEMSFQHFVSTVAAGQQAQMCRPLEKLAQRARKARAAAVPHKTLSDQSNVQYQSHGVEASGFAELEQYPTLQNIAEDWGFLDDFFVTYPEQ